jgi:cold shock protein
MSSQTNGNGLDGDVIEVSGHIKWFDITRGYGFIVVDNEDMTNGGDVLLLISVLRRDGHKTAFAGAQVVCKAHETKKGFQALRILSMDNSTAIKPRDLPQRTHVQVKAESDWEIAEVKWFNKIRGYGFFTFGDGTQDIFVHMETLRRFGFVGLQAVQRVFVRYGNGPKGLMAAELKPDTDENRRRFLTTEETSVPKPVKKADRPTAKAKPRNPNGKRARKAIAARAS